MARDIIYFGNQAYEKGYDDGFNDGQQKSMEEGYNQAILKAREWLHSNCYLDEKYMDRFIKAMKE